MSKQIIADAFETLGGVVQSTGAQVKQSVKKMGKDIKEGIGLPSSEQPTAPSEAQNPSAQTEEQNIKIQEANKKRTVAKYRQIQEEIKQMEQKRKQEMDKYKMPGFTDEEKQKKQIQQIQENREPEKKLPPLPVQRSQKRTEMNRGASG